jgi:DNA-binding transcriptional LysR family regulator
MRRIVVELRRFRYFVAVAEELHFRRAAERLHLAQPALSQQVRKLELELGVDLFHRSRRGVALTAAGAVFLEEARRVLRQADEAARAAQGAREGSLGRLRIGVLVDMVPELLTRAIVRFCSNYPGVEIRPETVPSQRAIEDVRSGRLDIATVGLPAAVGDLRITHLGREGTVVAVPERHPLSGRASIPLTRLADTPLLLLPRAVNPAFHDGVLASFRVADVAPSFLEAAEPQVEHVLMLVAAGGGLALLPASAAERYTTPAVRFCELESPAPTTDVGLVTRPEASNEAAVSAFLRLAQDRTRHRRLRSADQSLAASSDDQALAA